MRTTGPIQALKSKIKLIEAGSHAKLFVQLLHLEIKLASLTEQIVFHNVVMSDRCPKRSWNFGQRMKPATIDDQRRDIDDDC
jgi:hypothetical protein